MYFIQINHAYENLLAQKTLFKRGAKWRAGQTTPWRPYMTNCVLLIRSYGEERYSLSVSDREEGEELGFTELNWAELREL